MVVNMKTIILFLSAALFFTACKEKTGYVKVNYLYENFDGKKELEEKIITLENKQNYVLDSLLLVVREMENQFKENPEKQGAYQVEYDQYQRVAEEFRRNAEEKKMLFNERIWKHINQYLEEYGKKNEYVYIYGADGSGSLMYADSTSDISEPVLKYINEKYKGF